MTVRPRLPLPGRRSSVFAARSYLGGTRRRITLLAQASVLAAGLAACSAAGSPADSGGGNGTTVAPVATTAPTTWSPSTAPAATPAATSPSPTGAPPCRQNQDWDRAETIDWLRSVVDVSTKEVIVAPSDSAGTICRKVPVQIDFYKVTFRPIAGQGAIEYEATPVKRSTVSVDGRKSVVVSAPDDLGVGNCVTAMVTASVGGSLRSAELPAGIPDITGLAPKVYFRTDRLVDYDLDGLSSRLNLTC